MSESVDTAADIEARLDELQSESQQRRAELRAIAAELPDATSRRALVGSMFRSVATAPDKTGIAKRVVLKVLRFPSDLVRRVRNG
jgi:hypothetical protein